MKNIKVENMCSPNGREVVNQYIIKTKDGKYFQSYKSIIAFIPNLIEGNRKILLDEDYWNYSTTTGKYRNIFLGEERKDTEARIKNGEYLLVNLNN